MADAWEILFDNSTLGVGFDAWEHLNAQEGGTGGTLVLSDGLEVEVEMKDYDVEIELADFDVEIEDTDFEVEVETLEYEVEID